MLVMKTQKSVSVLLALVTLVAFQHAYPQDLADSEFNQLAQQLAHPNAEEVESSADLAMLPRQLVLGALENVNQVIEPERQLTVEGSKFTRTWYLPKARRTDEVSTFYKVKLAGLGQLLFSCAGRTCGSSNYWANRIMERAILYGPEQFQHYLVAQLEKAYLLVYIGQRATRKIYVHLELISDSSNVGDGLHAAEPAVEIVAALEGQGQYVIEGKTLDDWQVEKISRALPQVRTSARRLLVLVVHDALRPGETLATSLERTRQLAESLAERLRTQLADDLPLAIDARGLGPLSPSPVHGAARVELLLL